MPLLGSDYDSSEGEQISKITDGAPKSVAPVNPAPDVSLDVWSQCSTDLFSTANYLQEAASFQLTLTTKQDGTNSRALTHNVPYEILAKPAQGPMNPYKSTEGNALKRKNVPTGYAENTAISDATFTGQHRNFQSLGFAREPNASGNYVGDLAAAARSAASDVVQARSNRAPRKRQKNGDSSIVDGPGAYLGPWAKYEDEAQYEDDDAVAGEVELASDEEYEEDSIEPTNLAPIDKTGTAYQDDLAETETTDFNGSQLVDYQGRSYMHAPTEQEYMDIERCYHPKKLIHTWRHGTKPVSVLRFLPKTAHLLLSGGDDAKIKVFDVYRDKELLRTFNGHTKRISDLSFDPSGEHFLSASYDRYIKMYFRPFINLTASIADPVADGILRPGAVRLESARRAFRMLPKSILQLRMNALWACRTKRLCSTTPGRAR